MKWFFFLGQGNWGGWSLPPLPPKLLGYLDESKDLNSAPLKLTQSKSQFNNNKVYPFSLIYVFV